MTRLYKVLDEDRRACHGGHGVWPAPKDGKPGRWTPDLGDDSLRGGAPRCLTGARSATAS